MTRAAGLEALDADTAVGEELLRELEGVRDAPAPDVDDGPKLPYELSPEELEAEQRRELADDPVPGLGESSTPAIAAALEVRDALDCEDYDWLVSMLAAAGADDATVVDRNAVDFARLIGIDDRDALLAWVVMVRPVLLEWLAHDLNQCASLMGGRGLYFVAHGTVVDEGGTMHRELERREPAPAPSTGVIARTRDRGRRRRATRRTRARARSGEADDPAPPRGRHPSARAAA